MNLDDDDDDQARVEDRGSSKEKEGLAPLPPISKGKERVREECYSNQVFECQVSPLFNGINNYFPSRLWLHILILGGV